MDIKKPIWLYVLIVVLMVGLCSVFLSQIKGRNAGSTVGAIEEQNKKLAEQNRKLAGQDKRFAGQDKRLDELEKIAGKIDEIQAQLNTRKIDIKDSDMALIEEIIEKQVKLNVRRGDRPKIGVVSVEKIFQDCKRSAKYREETIAVRGRANAELGKLKAEIDADNEGLKTLKVGSSDYMALMKEVLTKQANLQVKQKFYEQQMVLNERRLIEGLYKDILRKTSEVAKEKGLDLVFERSEPKLPAPTANELTATISTHKLVYSGELSDITDDVIARLDSEE
ncbi:MAG: OmpH/Skp family outer membrane protein [Planctomycetota bacterium]|jgi:Skp family chaperone for outer membrane proteins